MRLMAIRFFLSILSCSFVLSGKAMAQEDFRILVFSKTAGFRHPSIADGIAAIQNLGVENQFDVEATEDASIFNSADLVRFQAVVFLSTTGDILDASQQSAFESYIRSGGGFAGIHSAADTEYDWPWYGELAGAWFQSHPAIQSAGIRVADRVHPATNGLPYIWTRTDEWYNYQRNPRGEVHVLATLDETSYSGGEDGFDHPISWCRDFDGGRSWYTGLGHTEASYTEPLFLQHILGGIRYAAGVAGADCGATLFRESFARTVLDVELSEPTELAIASDGRVFYTERGGRVKVYKPGTNEVVVAAQLDVFFENENGLMGIALDPKFDSNGWIYLYYSPARADQQQYLSRFTLTGDQLDLGSEIVVLAIPHQRDICCHYGGSLTFGPQGNLWLSLGDDTNPFESNGYAPIDERPGRSAWDAQKSASSTHDLRGGIIRIKPNPDGTYAIPEGNLFPADGSAGRPEIYVMGCRNPYRISVDNETGWLYWGDVGPDAQDDNGERGPRGYDEWNQAREPGFFGWPYFIGDNKAYRDFDFATGAPGPAFDPANPVNNSSNNNGAATLPPAKPAWIWYPYSNSGEFPELASGGRTAMAGPAYHYDPNLESDTKLPEYYDRTLFIFEWSRNFLKEVKMDENGDILKINHFLDGFEFDAPIDMAIGPEGAVYVLEYGSNFGSSGTPKLVRIDYAGGNNPTSVASRERNVPRAFRLSSVYPNPFNPETTIVFELPRAAHVRLEVFDILGRTLRTLHDGIADAGQHSATLNAADMATGIYLFSLTTPEGEFTQKALLLK